MLLFLFHVVGILFPFQSKISSHMDIDVTRRKNQMTNVAKSVELYDFGK